MPLGFATPLVRSFVAIPAGILEVPLRRFVPLAVIGITILCAALGGIGWAVGSNWDSARHAPRYVDFLVGAGILALAVVWFVRRRRPTAFASRS